MRLSFQFSTIVTGFLIVVGAVVAGTAGEARQPVPGAGLDRPTEPLRMTTPAMLRFAQRDVALNTVPTAKVQLGIAHSEVSENFPTVTAERRGDWMWQVNAEGFRFHDRRHAQAFSSTALTNAQVRPQDAVLDPVRNELWLYGENLYRYRIETRELHRFVVQGTSQNLIRKAVPSESGLWLATSGGIQFFDTHRETFRAIPDARLVGTRFVNVLRAGTALWFVDHHPRLVRIEALDAERVRLAVSDKLPVGVPAEMIAVHGSLWMLTSHLQGDSYRLTVVEPEKAQLQSVEGTYYSLREQDGRLLATRHNRLYRIDPAARTVAVSRIDPERSLRVAENGRILFVGSSYGVKDNCEVVEHRRVDLSKGWLNPGNDLYVTASATDTH